MFKRAALALVLALWAVASAHAQNTTCATRPAGDNSNACASTAFVQGAVSGGSLPQSANTVFAGPTSGAAAPPTFRLLVPADIPTNIRAITPQDYGAKCDGSTIDTTALQSWLTAVGTTHGGYIPPTGHACLFDAQLVGPSVDGVSISGAGLGASELRYVGANTNLTTIVFGTTTGSCSQSSLTLRDFLLSSATTMTGSQALLLRDVCGARLQNLGIENSAGGAYGNWYNGLVVQGGNQIYGLNNTITGSNVPLVLYGDDAGHSSTQLTDPTFIGGIIIGGVTGIDIAGNVGGASFDGVDVLGNKASMKISQDLVAIPNNQIFLGPRMFLDATIAGGTGRGLDIQDAGGNNSLLSLSGTWIASATTECLYVASGSQFRISWTGGWLANCGTDGLSQNSTTSIVSIKDVTVDMTLGGFAGSTGYGFNCTVANGNVWFKGIDFISWGIAGQFSSNCQPQSLTSNSSPSQFSYVINQNNLYPLNGWQYDTSSQTVVPVANTANAQLPNNASGMIIATDQTSGATASYICGGGACALMATSGTAWDSSTTTPGAGKSSVAYSGTRYGVYNNTGASVNYNIMLFRTRAAN